MIRVDEQPNVIYFYTDIHEGSPVLIRFNGNDPVVHHNHAYVKSGTASEVIISTVLALWSEVDKVYLSHK